MRRLPWGSGPVAVVVALTCEAIPLARHLRLRRFGVHEGVAQYRDRRDRVLLLQSGMGAWGAARALTCIGKPALLLSAGFCGGVAPEVGLGDLIVASRVTRNGESFPADPFLLEAATRAIKADGLPFHVGTILTVDEALAPTAWAQGRAGRHILAVDMESAHLAEGAKHRGIPFLGIRIASDTLAEPWVAEGRRFVASDGRLKVAALATILVRHPSWIPRLLSLAPKLRRATLELGRAIRVLLKELHA